MLIPCVGLDRRLLKKKNGLGSWAIVLVKLENGEVAEIFVDQSLCPDFQVGQNLALDAEMSCYDKRLNIKVKSINIAK